jgi:ankyrin repeat protein
MGSTDGVSSKSPLLGLPNELFLEVASHLKSFNDLNSLVRTSQFFHGMFNTDLYCRAIAANGIGLDVILGWVLSEYRMASLTLFLDHGLSVNYTGSISGRTMLRFLCGLDNEKRSVPLARLLIQRGADVDLKDATSSETVLFSAISHDVGEIAALLLEHGADPNTVNKTGGTPLYYAIKNHNLDMVNLLIAHGAAINGRFKDGETLLLLAIQKNNYAVISVLLAHGADVNETNLRGYTPLHQACYLFNRRHLYLLKSLVEHGANVNASDRMGRTPLHLLFESLTDDRDFMLTFLLENGADVNAVSNDGRSILQSALFEGCRAGVVRPLLARGANVKVLNKKERRELSEILWSTGVPGAPSRRTRIRI